MIDHPVEDSRPLTPGELAVDARIQACAARMLNALAGENNARVIAAAWLLILQDNPELSVMFEDLCGNWMVKQVIREGRKLDRELTGTGR